MYQCNWLFTFSFLNNSKFARKFQKQYKNLFFLSHLRITCWHDVPSCLNVMHFAYKMISKLILIHYYYLTLRPYSSFASCSNNEFMLKGSKSGACMTFSCHVLWMSFNLQEFLCLFLALPALTLLKMAHQLCYSMSLNFCLPNVSSRLYSVFVPLEDGHRRDVVFFLFHPFESDVAWFWFVLSLMILTLSTWLRSYLPSFPTEKLVTSDSL